MAKTDKTINYDRDEMYRLIRRYFDGETSSADESRLRSLLSLSGDRSDDVEEARAVMGVFATARNIGRKAPANERRRFLMTPLSAVASIAVLLVVSIGVATRSEASDFDKCYASVGGRVINDRQTIEAIVSEDLASISEASQSVNESVADDLSILRESMKQKQFNTVSNE